MQTQPELRQAGLQGPLMSLSEFLDLFLSLNPYLYFNAINGQSPTRQEFIVGNEVANTNVSSRSNFLFISMVPK